MTPADLRARYSVSDEPLRSERRVELVALLLAALALLQLLWLVVSYLLPPGVDAVTPAPDSMEVESIGQIGTLTSEQSRSIRARPVFWDSRRPLDALPVVVAEATAADAVDRPAAEKVLKDLTLSGIVANDRESRVIVTYKGNELRLAPGEDVAGWTLRRVGPTEAVFADSGREVVLRLRPRPVVAAAESTEQPPAADAQRDAPAAAMLRQARRDIEQAMKEAETQEARTLSTGG